MTKQNGMYLGIGALLTGILIGSCAQTPAPAPQQTTSHVIIGESNASGAEAAQELQLAINRSQTVGCEAISVGGYGAGGEGLIIGIAALMSCPRDIDLIPTGFPFDSTGTQIPVDPRVVIPPTIP